MNRAAAILREVIAPVALVLAMLCMICALAWCTAGCTRDRAVRTAVDAVAIAGDAAVRIVADAERTDGLRAIEASASLDDARARLDAVDAQWAEAWAMLDALEAAHAAARATLDAGGVPPLDDLVRAWCALVAAIGDAAVMPELPGVRCET